MKKIITVLICLIHQISFAQTTSELGGGFKMLIPEGCSDNGNYISLPDARVGVYFEKTFTFFIPSSIQIQQAQKNIDIVYMNLLNFPDGLNAYDAEGNECQPHCTFGPTGNGDWSELVIKGIPLQEQSYPKNTDEAPQIQVFFSSKDDKVKNDISGYVSKFWFRIQLFGCSIENDCNYTPNVTTDNNMCVGERGVCRHCEGNKLVDNDDDKDGICNSDDDCPQNAHAFKDESGECVGGDTGKEACTFDCEYVCGGSAIYITYYEDSDKDGFGDPEERKVFCSTDPVEGWVENKIDNCPKDNNSDQRDFDGDGLGDVCDPDDDYDGWPDEAGELKGTDFDSGDSMPNNIDVCGDSDNDGCDDCTYSAYDPKNDGLDTDGDGECDVGDDDDDGDGCHDDIDPTLSLVFVNTDGDDQADDCDDDDDNDGVTDTDEVLNRAAPLDPSVCGDSDKDGCDDCSQISATNYTKNTKADIDNDGSDTDGDGKCDLGDDDDDNDGVVDGQDSNPDTYNECRDLDGDSCDDCSKIADFSMDARADTYNDGGDFDKDGLCDMGDPDDDNDGALDGNDTDDNNKFICSDIDNDGCDDCTSGRYNPEADGDAEDKDDDDDGVDDADDYCDYDSEGINPHVKWMGIGKYENWKSDDENDRDGDGCRDEDEDLDDDGDGVADILDQCNSSDSAFNWKSQPTTDYDGDGCKDDEEDEDDDNDGVDDKDDSCDPDSDGEIIPYVNWMGIGNYENWKSDEDNDFDKDGCRDVDEDENDDNDGCSDATETSPWEYNSGIEEEIYYLDYDGDGRIKISGPFGGQEVFCTNNVPDLEHPKKWLSDGVDDVCPNRPFEDGLHPADCGGCGGWDKITYYFDADGDGYPVENPPEYDIKKFCTDEDAKNNDYTSNIDKFGSVKIPDPCPYNKGIPELLDTMDYYCDGGFIGSIGDVVQGGILYYKSPLPVRDEESDLVEEPYYQDAWVVRSIEYPDILPYQGVFLFAYGYEFMFGEHDSQLSALSHVDNLNNSTDIEYDDWELPSVDVLKKLLTFNYNLHDRSEQFSKALYFVYPFDEILNNYYFEACGEIAFWSNEGIIVTIDEDGNFGESFYSDKRMPHTFIVRKIKPTD